VSRDDALNVLAAEFGTDVDCMLEEYALESVVPGVCLDCHAVTDACEPDARDNWCSNCDSQRVKSCLVLAGLV
jgi:hypothetical protein